MISGVFTFMPDGGFQQIVNCLRNLSRNFGPGCSEIVAENLVAFFYHHPRLPGTPADFCFSGEESDLTVMISGYLYNQPEICNELNLRKDTPAPELVARLFIEQGPQFVNRLNGDFSIFIGLPSGHQAYLFRDHAGIRPLAYSISGSTLFFSSDIAGLCRSIPDKPPVETDFLLGYFKYIDYRKTPNEKVSKLLPGHYLDFSEKGTNVIKYWHPEEIRTDHSLTREQMLSDLKSVVLDAVHIRADLRFTAGAHVSSGLDSGVVSALARREYPDQQPFYGFSWSPANFDPGKIEFDERDLVRKTCETTGIQPLFSQVEQDKYISYLEQFELSKWYFPEDQVLQRAEELKVNLIFSGWGGDEFVSIGERGIDSDLIFGGKWLTFFRRYPVRHFKSFARTLLYYVIFPALGMLDFPTRKSFREEVRYLKRVYQPSDKNALRDFYFYTSRRNLHLGLLHFYHLQERCESWTISGCHRGVEYRYPLLDKRIIEYMLKVPSEILCDLKDDRIILREISKGLLPEEVRWHWQKNDPVASAVDKYYFKEAAIKFIHKTEEWKSNPDLFFINFSLLEKDIRRFQNGTLKKPEVLFRALVYIKVIHSFILKYHESDELAIGIP
jgi:asparagine synthase (glutamine-hydrolysing)